MFSTFTIVLKNNLMNREESPSMLTVGSEENQCTETRKSWNVNVDIVNLRREAMDNVDPLAKGWQQLITM